jgi:hypothetical protein
VDRTEATDKLSVHVLATTEEGTRSALHSAQRLTTGRDARVVLFVPSCDSSTVAPEPATSTRVAALERYGALARNVGVNATVIACVCQQVDDVVHQMLGESSLVIVGGRRQILWPTPEQRLVQRLTAQGYSVVFSQVGAERPRSLAPAIKFLRTFSGTFRGILRGDRLS